MQTFRNWAPVIFGPAIFAAFLVVDVAPGVAEAAPRAKERVYEGKFECAIPANGTDCSVTVDRAIPAGMRLRIDYIKARIVIPSRSSFEFSVEVGDPGASGGVRATPIVPTAAGRTEGGFYSIWAVNETSQAFAYRTEKCPAPKFHLNNPKGDPLKLQNGSIQDGIVGGSLVSLD
jgi:hypothetical protein